MKKKLRQWQLRHDQGVSVLINIWAVECEYEIFNTLVIIVLDKKPAPTCGFFQESFANSWELLLCCSFCSGFAISRVCLDSIQRSPLSSLGRRCKNEANNSHFISLFIGIDTCNDHKNVSEEGERRRVARKKAAFTSVGLAEPQRRAKASERVWRWRGKEEEAQEESTGDGCVAVFLSCWGGGEGGGWSRWCCSFLSVCCRVSRKEKSNKTFVEVKSFYDRTIILFFFSFLSFLPPSRLFTLLSDGLLEDCVYRRVSTCFVLLFCVVSEQQN